MHQDPELADAIQGEFCRFEPYMRRAVSLFVMDLHPTIKEQAYFVAMYNLPNTLSIRQLRTDLIGSLSAVTGTVTRTSDVRPELLVASFRCNKCGLLAGKIPQQYHYTRPTICRNPRCKNTSPMQFTLEIQESEFVDWQKLRVQENSNQIPPGSMPRSMDIILRNEMVENAKAGDKCVFVGSLVVLPDGSALARAGETAKAGRTRPSDAAAGGGGGVLLSCSRGCGWAFGWACGCGCGCRVSHGRLGSGLGCADSGNRWGHCANNNATSLACSPPITSAVCL